MKALQARFRVPATSAELQLHIPVSALQIVAYAAQECIPETEKEQVRIEV